MQRQRVLTSFKLKNPNQVHDLERALGHGQGARIEFRDRPGLPIDWDPPFIFYVNNIDVGFLDGDTLKIDIPYLQNHERNIYEKILNITELIPQKVNQ